MKSNFIALIFPLLMLLLLFGCSSEKKENQPPSDADQQRIENEYRQGIDKLHELTSGTKQTLDGKSMPKAKAKAQPSPAK